MLLKSSKQRHCGKRGECGESVNRSSCVMAKETDGYSLISEKDADGEG